MTDDTYNPDIEAEHIVDWYSGFTQFISWPLIYVVSKVFLKIEITGAEHFKSVRGPFMIIANHISFYDSFLFRLVLGCWTRHLPLRFMAVEKFDWKVLNFLGSIGVIKLLYLLFGVFTVVPGRGLEQNLKTPINIIKSGGNIVIYPEGKIVTHGELGPFKKGAAVLYHMTKVPVIPVLFEYTKTTSFRKDLRIRVGLPVEVQSDLTDEGVTDVFRKALESLKVR